MAMTWDEANLAVTAPGQMFELIDVEVRTLKDGAPQTLALEQAVGDGGAQELEERGGDLGARTAEGIELRAAHAAQPRGSQGRHGRRRRARSCSSTPG